jgi:serine/threonine protein kinase
MIMGKYSKKIINKVSRDMAEMKNDELVITRGKIIGSGAFANVYEGTFYDDTVAIKIMDVGDISLDNVLNEISVQRGIRHANIVPLIHVEQREEEGQALIFLVMPKYATSMYDLIQNNHTTGFHFDFQCVATILAEIASAMAYLHNNDIIHRDIKCGNILVSADGHVHLADFGVSALILREITGRHTQRKTFTGSLLWMAPEVMDGHGYSSKADVWSFGMTAMELVYGRPPFFDYSPIKVMMKTMSTEPGCEFYEKNLDMVYKIPKSFRTLIDRCIIKETKKRKSSKKILTCRFLKKYHKKGSNIIKFM